MFHLTAGQTIRHYRVTKQIGAGGMGVVYLARDTSLDRDVALKTLPPDLAADSDRRVRFAREAKALAALNHPNIVTVHSVEQADGLHFMTTEFISGNTLAALLPREGLELGKFFDIAIPLADALAAAHARGITHRDLKPANVMVTDDRRVKVLDFGLASADGDSSRAAAIVTETATLEGRIVGTPAYMSPEQAEGKPVDARSDIFSLGVLFYEMLSGRRPFDGDTPTAMLSAIIKDNPRPLNELRPAVPREISRLIHRCLAKNPRDRYQSALDVRHTLEEAKQDIDSGDFLPAQPPRLKEPSRRLIAVMLGAAMIAAGVGTWLLLSRAGQPAPVVRLQNPTQVTAAIEVEGYPTWSPDGGRIAYQKADSHLLLIDHDIWVTQLGAGEPVNLTAGSPANDRMPSWSPDGREIAFLSDRGGSWAVYTMSSIGGTPRTLLKLPEFSPSSWSAPQWSRDGSTLFLASREGTSNVVVALAVSSLEARRITLPDHESDLCWDLTIRPDGGRFAYVTAGGGGPEVSRLWTVHASGENAVPLTDGRTMVWSPTWSQDGRRLFYVSNRGGSMDLWQQTIDNDGEPQGQARALTQGVGMRSAAFSPDGGRLAYSRDARTSSVWRAPIRPDKAVTWADAQLVVAERAFVEFVDVSPDGQRLAVSSDRRGNQDVWILPSGGGEMTALARDPTPDWNPRWSPDGQAIAFYSYRTGNRDLWVMPSGGGPARQLTSDPARDWYPSWSPSGEEIAFLKGFGGRSEIWAVRLSDGESRRVGTGDSVAWSPDGQWLAVRRGGEIHRVPLDGRPSELLLPLGQEPNWVHIAPDGQRVYYSVVFGPQERHGVWALSLSDQKTSRLTNLEGRRGRMGYFFSADARFIYFTWSEGDSDIWVMDVATQ